MSDTPPKRKGLSNKENADLLWDFADDIHHVFSRAGDRAFFLDNMALKKLYKHAIECIKKAEDYYFSMRTQEGIAAARTLALLRRRLEPAVNEFVARFLPSNNLSFKICQDLENAVADFSDDLERLAVAFEYPLLPQSPVSIPTVLQPDFRIMFPCREAMEGRIKDAEIEKTTDEIMLEGDMFVKDFCKKYRVPRTTTQHWLELPGVVSRKCPDTGAVITSVPTLMKYFVRWKSTMKKSGKK